MKQKRQIKKVSKVSGETIKKVKVEFNWYQRATQFLREVRVELKKVTWPNKREIISSTLVVIAFIIIIAAYFGLIDMIYAAIIGRLLG